MSCTAVALYTPGCMPLVWRPESTVFMANKPAYLFYHHYAYGYGCFTVVFYGQSDPEA